jgi:hypothetical protein
LAHCMEIESWAQVHQCITQFPWINPLHNEAGEALWSSVRFLEHKVALY